MRDIDRDFVTKILVRRDAGIGALTDLHGKTVATGSRDSAQARILPLFFLRRAGVEVDRLNQDDIVEVEGTFYAPAK